MMRRAASVFRECRRARSRWPAPICPTSSVECEMLGMSSPLDRRHYSVQSMLACLDTGTAAVCLASDSARFEIRGIVFHQPTIEEVLRYSLKHPTYQEYACRCCCHSADEELVGGRTCRITRGSFFVASVVISESSSLASVNGDSGCWTSKGTVCLMREGATRRVLVAGGARRPFVDGGLVVVLLAVERNDRAGVGIWLVMSEGGFTSI